MSYNFIASTSFNKSLKGLQKRQRRTLEQVFELMENVRVDPYGSNTKAIVSNKKIGGNIYVRRVAFNSKDGNVPYRMLIVIHECESNRKILNNNFCISDPFETCHMNQTDCTGYVYFIGLTTRKEADYLYQNSVSIYNESQEAKSV